MNKSWKKLGKIYTPVPKGDYLLSHTANPTPIFLNDDTYRIFYSGRDKNNRSSVGFVDINILTQQIINDHPEPAFTLKDDSFYSHGISIGCTYEMDNETYMLFMGWKIEDKKHWYGTIGRFRVDQNKDLSLAPEKEFISLDQEDPISLSYPWVQKIKDKYLMYYGSTLTWQADQNDEMIHVIKQATSADGENWKKEGLAIPYEENIAQAFSKPTVIFFENKYHMWYSYRSGLGETYRIGYAISPDGTTWERHENNNTIAPSNEGWDSEMICYPTVFEHKNDIYMLYNGNQYGKSGFGLCILDNK